MPITVYVLPDQRIALRSLMARHKVAENRWWAPRRRQLNKIKSPRERSILRAKYKAQHEAAVEVGRLIITQDILIEPEVAAELDRLGWCGPYDPLPASAKGGGRRWGSTTVGADPDHQIRVRLSLGVHERLERACYHEQWELINALESFYVEYGDAPHLPDPRPGEEPDELARRYRDELRREIKTTGDIMRAAIDRVIGVVSTQVTLRPEQSEALQAVMDIHKELVRQWWTPRRKLVRKITNPVDRKTLRSQHRREYAAAVQSGELVVTPDVLIAQAVLTELDARNWVGPYPPVPTHAIRAGETDSTSAPLTGDTLKLRLGGEVYARLERSCYWESVRIKEARPPAEPEEVGELGGTPEDILRAAVDRLTAPVGSDTLDSDNSTTV